MLGASDGVFEGEVTGFAVGVDVREPVGFDVGRRDGEFVSFLFGGAVGMAVFGAGEGDLVGSCVG